MQRDPLADALFLASLSAGPRPGQEARADPKLDAAVEEALSKLPSLVEHRSQLDDWAPLLKIRYGDEIAARAAEHLERMLAGRSIKAEVRSNPWMMDMSKYLFVEVDSLVKAVTGGAK